MSLEGERIAALYAVGCPTEKQEQTLVDFVKNGESREEALRVLKKLDPYRWYQLIATKYGIDDIWDEKVVRALWTGNELTQELEYRGRIILPFHNFDILEVPLAEPVYRLIDSHKISVGEIVKDLNDTGEFLIEYRSLKWKDNKFVLEKKLGRRKIGKGFIKTMGGLVTFHFASVRETINQEDAEILIKKTEEAISLFNRSSDKSPVSL